VSRESRRLVFGRISFQRTFLVWKKIKKAYDFFRVLYSNNRKYTRCEFPTTLYIEVSALWGMMCCPGWVSMFERNRLALLQDCEDGNRYWRDDGEV
jgi:hypothetical protein